MLPISTKTEKVSYLMNLYDTNKSRNLGFNEFKTFLVGIGYPNKPNNDVQWFISLLDANKDSKISWSELYNGLK